MNYYQSNYQLMEKHHYSLSDLDMMIPWEREIYLAMLIEDLKLQQQQMQQG